MWRIFMESIVRELSYMFRDDAFEQNSVIVEHTR